MSDKTAKADVSPVRQRTQYTCMSASMAMCLNALQYKVTEDQVNQVMGAQPMKGAAWEQALACSQHFGCRATLTVPSTVKQLKEWTDQKIPVMIAWNPEGREWSHASVVFDVDDDFNVHVADPNIPDPDETVRVVSKSDFYGMWYEKWPHYLVRRPAMAIEREVTPEGRQVMASLRGPTGPGPAQRLAARYAALHGGFGDDLLWSARRVPTKEELKIAKELDWKVWVPHPLPEDIFRYFKRIPGSFMVEVKDLTPIRAREKGLANANRFMWLSYWGDMDPRKPLSLKDNGDGSYTVLDGNSTYANAKMSNWKHLLGIVES